MREVQFTTPRRHSIKENHLPNPAAFEKILIQKFGEDYRIVHIQDRTLTRRKKVAGQPDSAKQPSSKMIP